jgi:putative transposase
MIGGFTNQNAPANQFGPQSKNVASIIRGFKSAVTTQAKKYGFVDFDWQPLYHDHIIRNARAFENIENYIANNPLNWYKDSFCNRKKQRKGMRIFSIKCN